MIYKLPLMHTVRYDPRHTQRAGLLSQQGIGLPINAGRTPILNPSPNPRPASPALQPQTNATGNRRMSSRIPNQQIDMNTEGMMRIGGDMMGAASQGALPALSAGFQRYGDIMDYNRQGKMAEYEQQMLRANEEAERQRLALKMQQDAAKDEKDPADVSREIVNMQSALEALKDKQLTGAWDANYVKQWLDRSGIKIPFLEYGADVEKAANRLLLQELAVFATLEFTSKTKGAISDREMALFQKPIPKVTDEEQLWIDWITPRLEILRQVEQNGVSNEKAAEGGSSSTDSSIDDLLNQYAPNTTSN